MSTKLERLRTRLMALETELTGLPTYYLGPEMHAQILSLQRLTRAIISALSERLIPGADNTTPNGDDE